MILIQGLFALCISCLCGVIASVTFYPDGTFLQYILMPVCCTLTGLLYGALQKKGKLSVLAVLPAYLSLFTLSKDADGWIFVLLPAAFLTVLILKNFRPVHDFCSKLLLAGLGIGTFLVLVGYLFHAGNPIPAYLYLFAASGTALVRTLKLPGSERDADFQKNNILSLIGAALGMSAVSASFLWEGILAVLRWIYRHAIIPLLYGFVYVFYYILVLIAKVLGFLFKGVHFEPEFPEIEMGLLDGTELDSGEAFTFHDYPYAVVIRNVLVIVLLIALALWIIYKVRKMRQAPQYDTGKVETIRETVKKKEKVSGPRGSIRRTYRKYMQYLKSQGVPREEGSTSADLLKASVAAGAAPAQESGELRDVYLRARYDVREEPSADEAQQAKRLLNTVRKNV